MEFRHFPVMLGETISSLAVKEGGTYVDCTLGGGGHSAALLEELGKTGLLVAFDRDGDAIANAEVRFGNVTNIKLVHDNFVNVGYALDKLGVERIDGAMIDLGVSSYQLDNAERGFSYMKDAPLDMRMDTTQKLSAFDVVNGYDGRTLEKILCEYGEERYARRIAAEIVRARFDSPITTTLQLVEVVERAVPHAAKGDGHPAKRTFQAIRIEVNGELSAIEPTLRCLVDLLVPGGRLAVITFHSLEDRIVKQTFASLARGCECPPDLPVCVCGKKQTVKPVTKKPLLPSEQECSVNPRSHSAKLRVVEKL